MLRPDFFQRFQKTFTHFAPRITEVREIIRQSRIAYVE